MQDCHRLEEVSIYTTLQYHQFSSVQFRRYPQKVYRVPLGIAWLKECASAGLLNLRYQ